VAVLVLEQTTLLLALAETVAVAAVVYLELQILVAVAVEGQEALVDQATAVQVS
jgi:hypothetical protein